jgi:hypothetical protein
MFTRDGLPKQLSKSALMTGFNYGFELSGSYQKQRVENRTRKQHQFGYPIACQKVVEKIIEA